MAKNPLISWSNLTDSAGRKVSEYTLAVNRGGIIDWVPKIYMFGVDILWYMMMLFMTVSATILSWIGNPSWLDGLDNVYRGLTETAFSVVNPLVLSVAGFSIMMLFIFLDSAKSNSARLEKNDLNRIGAAIAMMFCIAVMAMNPFAILKFALSVVQVGVAAIAGQEAATLNVFSVDAMIRQPTLIITYNGAVSDACAEAWSKAGSLLDNGTCFDPGQNQPSAVTLVLAVLALVMSVAASAFAIWSVWKYVRHLSMAVLGFVSLPWVAAVSMFRRRQFDQLGQVTAVACGNLIMVFVVQVIALGGPTLVSKVMAGWGQTGSAVPQMFVLIITYLALHGFLIIATNKNSALVRSLKADMSSTLNTYMASPGSGIMPSENTSIKQMFRDMRQQGGALTQHVRHLTGKSAETEGSKDGKVESLKDVQSTVNMGDADASRPVIQTAVPGKGISGFLLSSRSKAKSLFAGRRAGDDPIAAAAEAVKEIGAAEGIVPPNSVLNAPGTPKVKVESEDLIDIGNRIPNLRPTVDSARNLGNLYDAQVASTMVSPNPEYGGLTHPSIIKSLSHLAALNTILQAASATGSAGGGPVVIDTEGNHVSHAQRMAEFQRAQSVSRRISAAALTSAEVGSDDTRDVQTSVRSGAEVATIIPARAIGRYRSDAVERRAPNAYLGSTVTRGDVTVTRLGLSPVCDRAQDEADIEQLVMKRRAAGKGGVATYPLDDPAHDVRFSPDRPGQSVSAAVGDGFGDNIY